MKFFANRTQKNLAKTSAQLKVAQGGGLKNTSANTAAGFTIIEVMLVLAIAGLMLIGLIGGSFAAIARQRYNDSVNDFADFLETMYSEAISPKSQRPLEDGTGSSDNTIILGKVLVFGYDYTDNEDDKRSVYTATLIANNSSLTSATTNATFLEELVSDKTGAELYCGKKNIGGDDTPTSVGRYMPLWLSELVQANETPKFSGYTAEYDKPFTGTIIIARAPSSNVIHTVYAPERVYNLRDNCNPENKSANTSFVNDLEEQRKSIATYYHIGEATGICVKSDDSAISREIRIAADGRNTSAIWVRNVDISEDGEPNRCEIQK